jgi:hypothetical protein
MAGIGHLTRLGRRRIVSGEALACFPPGIRPGAQRSPTTGQRTGESSTEEDYGAFTARMTSRATPVPVGCARACRPPTSWTEPGCGA